MVRISVISVTLLIACVTLPALAQAPPANTITCSSSTACKKGSIPVFTSNGGAAKVDDSIIKQSGSTISVAGSETVTTNISAGGNISTTGNVSGANVSASSNISAGGNVTATGNLSGGSVSTGGNVSAAGNVTGGVVSAAQLVSTAAQGTAPLQVTSTTQVSNLNASLLGGSAASAFQPAGSYAVLGTNMVFGYQATSSSTGVLLMTIPNLGQVLVDCSGGLSRIAFFPAVSGSLWFVNGGATGFASGSSGTQLSNQSTDDLITAQFATTTQNATMVISGHPASTCIYSGQATVQGPGLHDAKAHRGRRSR